MSFFSPPPPSPVPTDPTTFRTRAINMWTWLTTTLLGEMETLNTNVANAAAALTLNSVNDTSTSSVLIGTGTKVFTVSAGKSYQPGMWLTISNTPAPTNQMIANVTSYSGTTLTVTVPATGVFGSGTLAAWTIALTAAPSAQIAATFLPVASAASLAASRTAMDVPSNADLATKMGTQYLQVQDQKASGADGGASAVGSQTRTLNTVVTNTITGASVASNIITLPAGTYRVKASAPSFTSNKHRLRLRNLTDSTNQVLGTSEYSTGAVVQSRSFIDGQFTIAGVKTFDLSHYCSAVKTVDGLGVSTGDGLTEIYTTIEIWKV